jgi:rubrerythrin
MSSCNKTKFKQKYRAEEFLKQINSIQDGKKKPIRTYKCEICGTYHLTSQIEATLNIKLKHEEQFKKYITEYE